MDFSLRFGLVLGGLLLSSFGLFHLTLVLGGLCPAKPPQAVYMLACL
jgi:hypothetical protein